ncbi:hypothetical protein WUBG_17661, partial [Wuchereria bancrofti]
IHSKTPFHQFLKLSEAEDNVTHRTPPYVCSLRELNSTTYRSRSLSSSQSCITVFHLSVSLLTPYLPFTITSCHTLCHSPHLTHYPLTSLEQALLMEQLSFIIENYRMSGGVANSVLVKVLNIEEHNFKILHTTRLIIQIIEGFAEFLNALTDVEDLT